MCWAVVWCDAMSCGLMWCDDLWFDVMRCGAMWWHVLCVYVLPLNFSVTTAAGRNSLYCCSAVLKLCTAGQQCSNSVLLVSSGNSLLLVSSAQALYHCWSAVRKLFITAGQQWTYTLSAVQQCGKNKETTDSLTQAWGPTVSWSSAGSVGWAWRPWAMFAAQDTIIYSKSTLSWQHDTWWEGTKNMRFLIEQFVVIDKTA